MERGEGFGRERRITHRQDFLRVQEVGKKLRSAHFLLSFFPRREEEVRKKVGCEGPGRSCRLGITVTTKVDKRAVRRNLLKRRLREMFRKQYLSRLGAVDLVVIALQGACELNYTEIAAEIEDVLNRALNPRAHRGRRREQR